jgi:predicted secreted hydrolase
MSRRRILWVTATLVLALGASLSADRVKLKSGKVVEGMFIGADSRTVRVLLDNGQVTETQSPSSSQRASRRPRPLLLQSRRPPPRNLRRRRHRS